MEITEHRNQSKFGWGKTHDLFGFADIFALRDGEKLLVQVTSYSNVSARIRKINSEDLAANVAAVRKADIRIVIHGWRKVKGRWTFREVDLS